jgi:hypothetical protein
MEINITVFIQALIFLMLFIFLSKTLFVSLQNTINARNILVDDEKKDISLINDKIIHQKYHIKKVLFLMADRVKRKHKYFNKGNILEKQMNFKRVSFKNAEKHKRLTFKLRNEILTSKLRLMTYKKAIKKDIIEKLLNNR